MPSLQPPPKPSQHNNNSGESSSSSSSSISDDSSLVSHTSMCDLLDDANNCQPPLTASLHTLAAATTRFGAHPPSACHWQPSKVPTSLLPSNPPTLQATKRVLSAALQSADPSSAFLPDQANVDGSRGGLVRKRWQRRAVGGAAGRHDDAGGILAAMIHKVPQVGVNAIGGSAKRGRCGGWPG
eukprot:1147572-Pelagomonas_calceolata.AAC.1